MRCNEYHPFPHLYPTKGEKCVRNHFFDRLFKRIKWVHWTKKIGLYKISYSWVTVVPNKRLIRVM